MESEKFSTSGLYWLCKEAEHRSSAADSPVPEAEITDLHVPVVEKRRRGRPPKGEAEKKKRKLTKKEDEDEDVCFICFDGGSLVLCDRGDCPKAYHPACIKRDEAFFQTNAKWTCGWHICSKCQKSVSRYMCFTCTYSLCKGCTKDADYLSVRGNKGFCSTCYRVVMMIENIGQGNKETVQVDFDDKLSWEYLFKVYWICLKNDLSLTVEEITRAQKPWTAPSKVTRREKPSAVNYSGNNGTMTSENPTLSGISNTSKKLVSGVNNTSAVTTTWASKELLDFVAYTRNGDTSVLSQKEAQALLFDHIKRNNLRDPHQRSEIICDSKLENLFRKPRVRHFEMLSLLEFHFLKKESQRDEVENAIIQPVVRQATAESNSDNLQMISENSIDKVSKKNEERVDANMVNEGKEACEKLESHVDSSGSINNGVISKSLSGVKSETPVASLSTGSTPSTNDKETENSWHYRDPTGKIQGPFSIEHFHKWSSAGTLPPDMQIWRLNTEERDSLRLVDVIKGQSPLQNNLSLSPQEVKNTSDSTSRHCDGSANFAGIDTDAQSNGKVKFAKGKETVPHSSNSTTPVTNNDAVENSSKHRDPPEVISSYSNHPQVLGSYIFNEKPHEISVDEKPLETSVDEKPSNVEQTRSPCQNNEKLSSQGNTVSQTTGGQCHENQINEQRYFGQPSDGPVCQNSSVNYLNPHESHPQYASMANPTDDSEQKSSINLQDIAMTMPKTSTGELQAQPIKAKRKSSKKKREKVNNDAKMENSSKCWEPSGVITSYPNHVQVQQISTFTEKPQETSVDKNRSNLGKNWSSTPDNEKLSSQGTVVSQTIGRQCNENQINEQHYLGRLSSDGPLCENSSVNNGNIHTSHPQYTSMDNSTNASEQKFSINLEDMPMIMPKTRTGELQPQTVKPKRKNSKTRMEKVKGKGKEGENSWHYRDLSGKVQGPFAIKQLHKWSSTGTFPPDMRIWRLNTEESDSVLLVDVIRGQTLLQNNLSISPQEVKGTSDGTSHHCDRLLSSSVNSAGTDTDAHSNCKLEFAKGYEPPINNHAKIENSSKNLAPAPPKVINSCSNQPEVHFTEKPHETFVHESRRDVGQTRSSTPNYEINVQHGNMMSQTTSRHSQGNQINEHYYLDRPSEDQNSSVNNWNSHKSHPHNTSTSNPTEASEQKFSIHLQDSPMSMPKPSTGGLQPQTFTPMASSTDASQEKFSINLQDFPMPMPKISTAELQPHNVKEQWWDPPLDTVQSLSTQNVLSLTTKSIDHGEKDYPQKKMTSLTPEYEKIQATENSSNFFLGGGTHLHKQSTKPSMEEWDSCFLSVSSLRPQETVNNRMATLTSKCDEFPPPSPPNPVPNASSWLAMVTEPIEFNTLAEESVSDLLAEVDAMESNSDLASPNLLMDYADDLFHDSKTDCFSSLRGLSFPLDQGKNDALNSSGDINIMLPPQSIMREEPILAHSHSVLDPFKKPRKHSSTSSVLEIETKDQFEFRSNRPNSSPKKKTRDLADIMNGPTKHGNSKSPGSTRRESDQGTPRGSGSKNRSTSGGRESHQKHGGERLTSPRERNLSSGGERLTSPRERNLSSGGERLTSPRDRNVSGDDLGFSKGRPSWSRQSSFGSGGGGHSRTVPRGQRVCKFYENGYCRKGAFCEYLHP